MASVLDCDGRRLVKQRLDGPATEGQKDFGCRALVSDVVCQMKTDMSVSIVIGLNFVLYGLGKVFGKFRVISDDIHSLTCNAVFDYENSIKCVSRVHRL